MSWTNFDPKLMKMLRSTRRKRSDGMTRKLWNAILSPDNMCYYSTLVSSCFLKNWNPVGLDRFALLKFSPMEQWNWKTKTLETDSRWMHRESNTIGGIVDRQTTSITLNDVNWSARTVKPTTINQALLGRQPKILLRFVRFCFYVFACPSYFAWILTCRSRNWS